MERCGSTFGREASVSKRPLTTQQPLAFADLNKSRSAIYSG